jgi:RNA 2',3'-cyclic 3'-phosphodiesterase
VNTKNNYKKPLNDTTRSFIAITLNSDLQRELSCLQDSLKSKMTGVTWVKPANLHITLKFLGSISHEQINHVKIVLSQFKNQTPFELSLCSLGAFPSAKKPKVIWVGVKNGFEELKNTQKKIESDLAIEGFEKEEREFSPHLTIGRIKFFPKDDFQSVFDAYSSWAPKPIFINKIFLMSSQLTPNGSIYSPIEIVNFKDGG